MAENDESNYQGDGFTGKQMEWTDPQKSAAPRPAPVTEPQGPYCHACNTPAELLPDGKFWCPRCSGGPRGSRINSLASVGVALAFSGAAVITLWILLFGGISTIKGLANEGNSAAVESQAASRTSNSSWATAIPQAPPTTSVLVQPSCRELMAGCEAIVGNTGTWLNVRDEPSLSGSVVGRLKDGDTVFVVDGPVQRDGYTWWQIGSSGGTGWAAEGNKDGTRWLLPVAGGESQPVSQEDFGEPQYCQELAEIRVSLEAEGLWEYVKSQLELSPNGVYLSQCSAWE